MNKCENCGAHIESNGNRPKRFCSSECSDFKISGRDWTRYTLANYYLTIRWAA